MQLYNQEYLMDDLVVGIGSSSERDSAKAGIDAAKSAMQSFKNKSPQAAIVLASKHMEYKALLNGIISITGHWNGHRDEGF